jgi:hypothetical protein
MGVNHVPISSPNRRMAGRVRSDSRITAMILAYRESEGGRTAWTVSAVSPLIAPEITSEPTVLVIRNGSPVK